MIRHRLSRERGHFDHGWLDTYHSFSFGEYADPRHDGFRSLRVLNEDRVAPGRGFGRHGHRDMEILTLVLEGALRHQDSLGSGSVITPGEIQRMTAGTGILHSEANPSTTEPVHLIQIWIIPDRTGYAPEYEERKVDYSEASGRFKLLASPDGRDETVRVHQDVTLWLGQVSGEQVLHHEIAPGRHAWVQVTRGAVRLEGKTLQAGDAAALSEEPGVSLNAAEGGPAEVLLFDLA